MPAPTTGVWNLAGGRSIPLDRPRLMAILNLTPDSFYDGGRLPNPEAALAAAARAVDEGADILDIGGESTRPGAQRIGAEEQIARVVPLIRAVRSGPSPLAEIPISIDTTLAPVARAALDAGADAINDVSAGTEDAGLLPLAAERRAGLILMHRLLPPDRDRYSDRYERPPAYRDLVEDVRAFLADRVAAALAAGCDPGSILIDPGLGFGKTVDQNLELIRRTRELADLPLAGGSRRFPVLSALSRKSFVGRAAGLAGSAPADRLAPTLALSAVHLASGASIFRVHDVREHALALHAAWAAWAGDPPAGLDRVGGAV